MNEIKKSTIDELFRFYKGRSSNEYVNCVKKHQQEIDSLSYHAEDRPYPNEGDFENIFFTFNDEEKVYKAFGVLGVKIIDDSTKKDDLSKMKTLTVSVQAEDKTIQKLEEYIESQLNEEKDNSFPAISNLGVDDFSISVRLKLEGSDVKATVSLKTEAEK